MQEILNVLYLFGAIGIWITVFWLAKLIINMKSGISAQADIINSFKSQTEYINSVQDTVSKLYDPLEIEKLIKTKTESAISEEREKNKEALENWKKDLKLHYGYIARSVIYLNDSQIKDLLSNLSENDENFEKFVWDMRASILEIRNEHHNESKNT